MNNRDLALIGNCQIAALIDADASIVWYCAPRLDGDPVFSALLSGNDHPDNGVCDLAIQDHVSSEQRYLRNSAIVETILRDRHGGALRVIDFAPRFEHFGRKFRPVALVRIIEPVEGRPRIRIRLRPAENYSGGMQKRTYGSHHVRYVGTDHVMRLTTDGSLSHILEESEFVLERPVTLYLGPDEPVREPVDRLGRHFLDETHRYWQNWVQGLSIPFEWQEAVIRAAITLKLCTFEDTGAVVAAITTSIPEAADSGRNWDYRFCWLRDAYFVIQALNRLGATRTMEGYMRYIINIAGAADGHRLQPVYGISAGRSLEERTVDTLPGYRGMGPVRVGNQAYEQIQNDVYGAVVLAATQAFFDERLAQPGDAYLFERLEEIGDKALRHFDQPDAGLWEYRGRLEVHTFSVLMCWAACDRLARIAAHLGLDDRAAFWSGHAERIAGFIDRDGWNGQLNSYTGSFGGTAMDASLLMMHELGFKDIHDPRFQGTLNSIEEQLRHGSHLFRYTAPDDFGAPDNAFNICTFWYMEALAAAGREAEARELFENMLSCRNPLGLLSEDIDPATGELWGNVPQTYSMAGIINVATRLSRTWREAF
jgi:GH15 family glucan-1,4-alpha-glucosidase